MLAVNSDSCSPSPPHRWLAGCAAQPDAPTADQKAASRWVVPPHGGGWGGGQGGAGQRPAGALRGWDGGQGAASVRGGQCGFGGWDGVHGFGGALVAVVALG
jgi:hypothetical protein